MLNLCTSLTPCVRDECDYIFWMWADGTGFQTGNNVGGPNPGVSQSTRLCRANAKLHADVFASFPQQSLFLFQWWEMLKTLTGTLPAGRRSSPTGKTFLWAAVMKPHRPSPYTTPTWTVLGSTSVWQGTARRRPRPRSKSTSSVSVSFWTFSAVSFRVRGDQMRLHLGMHLLENHVMQSLTSQETLI